jgi:DNA-binding LacI/PurR family transcriptional regulator
MDDLVRRPRLEDLAREVGISRTAVSYVLNGRPGVSEETRQRVLRAVERIGYRHPRASRGSSPGEGGGTLGAALSPTRHQGETPNYFVAELLAGVEKEARGHGFQINVEMWTPGRSPGSLGAVQGMLFLGGAFDPAAITSVPVPSVLVGTSFAQVPTDSVLADNRRGIYLSTAHLLQQGLRRLALLNGPPHAGTTSSKQVGFLDAFRERELPWNAADMPQLEFSVAAGEEMTRALLNSSTPPDGVVAGDDVIAIGALHAAQELGVRVPDELAIVGFGDSPAGALLRPALSTVHVFQEEMGRLAVRRLLDRLGDVSGSAPYVRSLVSPTLVVRESSVARRNS